MENYIILNTQLFLKFKQIPLYCPLEQNSKSNIRLDIILHGCQQKVSNDGSIPPPQTFFFTVIRGWGLVQ